MGVDFSKYYKHKNRKQNLKDLKTIAEFHEFHNTTTCTPAFWWITNCHGYSVYFLQICEPDISSLLLEIEFYKVNV